jgi:hypothetical protein
VNTIVRREVLVTIIAVSILITTPMPRVRAKPITRGADMILVPNQNRIKHVIRVETLPSRIAGQARLKPASIAALSVFPDLISSFILSKIRTLASTAIPIESIKAAMLAMERVTGTILKMVSIIAT